MQNDSATSGPPIPQQIATFLSIYNANRDYMRFEHELQNQRSTWHNVIQGLLFTALGVIGARTGAGSSSGSFAAQRIWLPFLLAGTGVTVAILAFVSIRAAGVALTTITERWDNPKTGISQDPLCKPFLHLVPGIAGGGSEWAKSKGKLAAHCIPIVILAVWLGVIGLLSWDCIGVH